ncbi:hypothetical protein MRB53_033016 [Persea americana]|uniref:Uncharacterized protein n=1 Tax=Persea americana TaxID=3435 RepID=A0ACC2KUD9_PERAE|nr:hypothetical protein MRB53_033016 [Persea americana]
MLIFMRTKRRRRKLSQVNNRKEHNHKGEQQVPDARFVRLDEQMQQPHAHINARFNAVNERLNGFDGRFNLIDEIQIQMGQFQSRKHPRAKTSSKAGSILEPKTAKTKPDLAILLLQPRDGSAGDPPSPATAAAAATSAVSSRSPATRSGNSGLVAAEILSDWAACDFLHDDETVTRSGDLSPVPAIFFSTVNGFLYALQRTDRTGNKQIVSDHLVICAALLADPITPSPTDPLKIRSVRSPSITPTML